MAFTYEDAFALIGTDGYPGVECLRRLISETSAIP
jgi:hypothetical protein